jgi:uncharacterized protein
MADIDVNAFYYDPLKHDTLIGQLDPFRGAFNQTHRMRAFVEVIVDGLDVTNKLDPYLISVRFQDGGEQKAEIELDDRDGRLPIPPINAPIDISFGWAKESMVRMFEGFIGDVEHGFGRKQGGRRMWIHCIAIAITTRFKEPMQDNAGDGAPPGQKEGKMIGLPDWVQQIGKNGGVDVYVNSIFSKFKQDHWAMNGASPMHEITSLAEKFGAMKQYKGRNRVMFEDPGERGQSCRARWRDNLIGYRVHPWASRSSWGGAQAMSFDKFGGSWLKQFTDKAKSMAGPGAAAAAIGGSPAPAATAGQASQANDGAGGAMDSANIGRGRIVINGEPRAVFDSIVSLEGVRPGVDGDYQIWVAEHIYSRQGYVTWLDVTPFGPALGSRNVWYGYQPRPNPNQG